MEHVPKRKSLRQLALEAGISHTTVRRRLKLLGYLNVLAERFGWDALGPVMYGKIGLDYWESLLVVCSDQETGRKLLTELASDSTRRERHRRILLAMQPINEELRRGLEHFSLRQEERERFPEALLRFIDEGP